tara:strand:- start:968 stop:1387 length:420 start_codon:yes stop_codon:yes gene_type:complete
MRIYIDGIFDLFHYGHLQSFLKCKNLFEDVYLLVGVINDETANSYKRLPIINNKHRVEIIKNIKCVDKVIENAPLIITEDFIRKNEIDYIVHGFSNIEDAKNQDEFFSIAKKMGKFKEIDYCTETSTTEIIEKIRNGNS